MAKTCPKCRFENPDNTLYCGQCGAVLKAAEGSDITKTLVSPAEKLQKGTTLAGRYAIIEELGRGGMGVVYKAEDTKLKRTVALKFLPQELIHIPEVKARFMREAQAAAALDHPNICTVHEFDETEETTFISMAYIKGQSLKKKLDSGPLELEEAFNIAVQVAEGLWEAHKKGIVHRDIKSGNIMVTDNGQAKIMDFGLARKTEGTLITKEGSTMGTIAYMSPEQAQGEKVDHRTDIWSFGVVLYEMLTGKLPFRGEHEQTVVYSILKEKPKPVTDAQPEVPVAIEQVINKALEKNPDKRYQQIDDLLDDLKSIAAGIIPEEIKARLRKAKLSKRKRIITVSAMIAVIAILSLFIILRLFHSGDEMDKSIAVVPFHYLSDEPEKQYLADGVMEAILLNLSKMEDLRVVSRTSVEQYRETDKTVNTICQELDVAYLLEGSFQKFGDKAKLVVQLIKPGKERHVWANEYDRNWTEIFAVQSEVAQTVARELQVAIAPEEKQLIEKIPTTNMTAYDAYLHGQFHLDKVTLNDLDTAMRYFELAIVKDPEFAEAYVGIAGVWVWRQQFMVVSADEAAPKIREACEKALELDSSMSKAYEMLAGMHAWGSWDWKVGEEALKKAITTNPNSASAHSFYAFLLSILGRTEEAAGHMELGLKLDPHGLFIKCLYSWYLLYVHRYDDCISVCREVLDKSPDYFIIAQSLYTALFLTGRYEESLEAMELFYKGEFVDFDHAFDQYEKLGYAGTLNLEIDTLLEQSKSKSKSVRPTRLADLYLYTGNKERTLYWLEQAYEMRDLDLPCALTFPDRDILRGEPRYQELLRKMNLPLEK
ncbi:MAG: protein kinase [Candidatus Aminicenantes bacterium]|nr:protein kinase [Candidatus Aminicenantes bacterium]